MTWFPNTNTQLDFDDLCSLLLKEDSLILSEGKTSSSGALSSMQAQEEHEKVLPVQQTARLGEGL